MAGRLRFSDVEKHLKILLKWVWREKKKERERERERRKNTPRGILITC